MIYADHAATTPVSLQALSAMMPYFTQASGNPSALYHLGRQARHAVEKARADIASCLHAQPEQIFFTSGGTESDNWALRAVMCIHPSKTIVTTRVEHHAVLQTCQALKREGVQIRFCEVDDKGVVSKCAPEVLCGAGLVSVMLANNEIGSIEPVQEIAAAAHAAGALVHTDAVQAVGHIPVHVDVLDVDFLSASAHKFNGPKGIGFLFARDPSSLRPLLYGGGQEHGMRSGTENVPAIAGMAAALQAHNAAMKKTRYIYKNWSVSRSRF